MKDSYSMIIAHIKHDPNRFNPMEYAKTLQQMLFPSHAVDSCEVYSSNTLSLDEVKESLLEFMNDIPSPFDKDSANEILKANEQDILDSYMILATTKELVESCLGDNLFRLKTEWDLWQHTFMEYGWDPDEYVEGWCEHCQKRVIFHTYQLQWKDDCCSITRFADCPDCMRIIEIN